MMPTHPIATLAGLAGLAWVALYWFAYYVTWELIELAAKMGAVVGFIWAISHYLK